VISLAGKVTTGLVESNSSLPSGLGLMSPDCQKTRISSMPSACHQVWDYFSFLLTQKSLVCQPVCVVVVVTALLLTVHSAALCVQLTNSTLTVHSSTLNYVERSLS